MPSLRSNNQISSMFANAPTITVYQRTGGMASLVDLCNFGNTALRNDSLLLQRPGLIDDKTGVVADLTMDLGADRLRVGVDIAVERAERCGLVAHGLIDIGKILICGDGEQADQEAVDHAEILQEVADGFIETGLPASKRFDQGPDCEDSEPA